MSSPKKITKKALREYVHEKNINMSSKAWDQFKDLSPEEALKVADLSIKITKDNGRKTIKDTDVRAILDAIEYTRSV